MTPEAFVAQCRTLLGVRFWHQGRSRTGVDCVGLCVVAAAELGIVLYDEADYSQHINTQRLQAGIEQSCSVADMTDLRLGDIMLFSIQGNPQHVGVFAGEGWFIHAWDKIGEVSETRLSKFWLKKLYRTYRWRGW